MGANLFSGWHLIIVLFIILLLFGAPKLPGLAKSIGQSMKILKKEVAGDDGKGADDATAANDSADTAASSGGSGAAAPAAPAAEGSADDK